MSAPALRTSNDGILEILEPFLVVAPWNRPYLDDAPFGLDIPDEHVVDPTRVESETFLRRLSILDGLTFGPTGMPMPPWVFYHTAEIPGAIFGLAHRAETLPAELASRLKLSPGDEGLMPLSMYIAMPTRAPGTWLGHNLASLNRLLPELRLRGLASITKALALRTFRCRCQIGAVQWPSPALGVHTRFGPLELLTGWTPAHSEPHTLTYRWTLTDERLRSGLGGPGVVPTRPKPDFEIVAEDVDAAQDLQRRIEAGERFVMPGPPRRAADGTALVPISEVG